MDAIVSEVVNYIVEALYAEFVRTSILVDRITRRVARKLVATPLWSTSICRDSTMPLMLSVTELLTSTHTYSHKPYS